VRNNAGQNPQSSSGVTRWQHPGNGEIKCNVDAALFNEQQKFGIGICAFVMIKVDS
ncbi:hypothetical protein A2U01_0112202, partial [Trifolium medium]|nr:hypothetical protein [Trifolium medium]